MFGLGIWELLLIAFIIFLLFGARKLPQIGEGVGKGIANFKRAISGEAEVDVTPKEKEIGKGKKK